MRRRCALTLLLGATLALVFDFTSLTRADDELDAHLKTLRRQVEDRAIAIDRREGLALEMAATFDRAAQSSATSEERRGRWSEAIAVIDEFEKNNPGHPQSAQFQTQSAIYLWAQARSWEQQWETSPHDVRARDEAIHAEEAALARLEPLYEKRKNADDPFGQNVRFRLAQTLADRAAFDPEGSELRGKRLERALGVLKPRVAEPALQGYADLLRARLLGRLGRFGEALSALDASAKAKFPAAAAEVVEVRADVLIGQKKFADALKAIESSPADADTKGLLAVRTRLAERAALPPGKERSAVESALFKSVNAVRAAGKMEARLALLGVAKSVGEPDASQGPDAWDAVAEGALGLGQFARAGRCEAKGADRADALGDRSRAAEMRLRAGAYQFQAESFAEADALLTRVVDDPRAGAARPKAGLLRALARGRALALGKNGASQPAYVAALEDQIRLFPNDPSAGEARWMLGKVRLAQSDRKLAASLWGAVAPGHPRWLEARLAVARLNQDDVDTLRLGADTGPVKDQINTARRFLGDSREQARNDSERNEIDLQRARLELTPGVGKPEETRAICERILKSATPPQVRGDASRLHLVALAELNHYVEAERTARAEAAQTPTADLLATARLIDRIASETGSDLHSRRLGLLMRLLLAPVLEREESLSPEQRWEAKLRMTRAQIFSGNTPAAEKSLSSWAEGEPPAGDRFAKDLADAYFRLDAFEHAADVERLRGRRSATGSLPWFDARFGLALAYYRAGKEKEARQLIDATAILHPDLGGAALREKFVRLRQRLDSK